MFLKNFRIKSNTAIRGSDRRKLRSDIQREFPHVTQEFASEVIPNKGDISVMKILTHSGQNVTAYMVNGSLILFQMETKIYPTVYLLWKYPDMIPVFTTWPNVFEKLRGGAGIERSSDIVVLDLEKVKAMLLDANFLATCTPHYGVGLCDDLMLPGIIATDKELDNKEREFQKDQVCSVALLGNRAPVAVGYTAVSSSEAREQGMRGKGVIILHSYLDQLWFQGSKCDIPVFPSISDTNCSVVQDTENVQTDSVDSGTNEEYPSTIIDLNKNDTGTVEETSVVNDDRCTETISENRIKLIEHTAAESTSSSDSIETTSAQATDVLSVNKEIMEADVCFKDTNTTLDGDSTASCSADVMNKRLERSFMHALLYIKSNDLPILTSTFYKNHLLPCCQEGQTLDIKKSSYKKLTKFLQVMENRGFIVIKEQSKGVHCIDTVKWEHEDLKSFKKEKSDVISEKRRNDNESVTSSKYQPPEIKEVFAVSGSTRSVFESLGHSKGSILTAKEVRQVITDYIKSQELAESQNKRMVKLDPVLFSVVHKKGEDNFDSLPWDEVFKRITDGMNPCHIVTFNGQAPITRKGKLELIEVKLEQRMGNKKSYCSCMHPELRLVGQLAETTMGTTLVSVRYAVTHSTVEIGTDPVGDVVSCGVFFEYAIEVTLVHNLEYYGIDPGEFSHKLQLKAASSTSVSQLPGKSNPGQQVLIQGNQIFHVARTLQDDYQIAAKYINGLDKLKQPKNKKK